MADIRKILGENILLLDGGMGTMLIKLGADIGTCPEALNITHREIIEKIHRAYIESGAQAIYTNTFGCSKKLPEKYSLESIIEGAVNAAKAAAAGKECFIGYDMGPTGKMLEPLGNLPFEEAYAVFKRQALLAEKSGVDFIVCETFTDLYEMKAALLAVKENTNLPILCTMSYESNMRTFLGTEIRCMAVTLEALGADAIGINCSLGPDGILPIAKVLLKYTSLPVIVKANAGIPQKDGTYGVSPSEFADSCRHLLEAGVSIIGGCCGTTPEYTRELKKLVSGRIPVKKEIRDFCGVCSASRFVEIDNAVIVGERLNPTGKKLYKEALLKGDMDFILSQAYAQEEAGADILDLNAGLPQIDEIKTMTEAVKAIQGSLDIPLQIDSSSAGAIEAALRVYNGRPILNSVNGDSEMLEKILPVAKKYGAAVIGLTIDKDGIPKTVEKRIEIAKKIIDCAKKYGIKKSDIIIDPLSLTVSAEQEQAFYTLEAVRRLSADGIRTVLGVSNISFGLPEREHINLAFMVMALHEGLSLAIINPNSDAMTGAVKAFRALSGKDKNAAEYVEKYGTKTVDSGEKNMAYYIVKGMKNETAAETVKLLETISPLEVVNSHIIPALDRAGMLFEKGTLFLPQLIQSAESAKLAFEEIKKKMPSSNLKGDAVILATVKGDVHDIGKNIVKTVLENYGYNVIDLGKNVDGETILDAAKKYGAKFVGLSALMTTTVSSMESAIKLLKANLPDCKVVAGGAVLSEDYALKIGADYYAKDANAAVKIAREIYGR